MAMCTTAVLDRMHRDSASDSLRACALALRTMAALEPGLALSTTLERLLALPRWYNGDLRALKMVRQQWPRALVSFLFSLITCRTPFTLVASLPMCAISGDG